MERKLSMTANDLAESIFLQAVDHRLRAVLTPHTEKLPHSAEILSAAGRYLCLENSAKRARPLLVLYFSQCLALEPMQMVDAAVAAELIHAASLMHDDVVDNASMRRGNPSVNVQHGNLVAVLGGNYLLSQAFALLNTYPAGVIADAVEVIASMTKAAIAEVEIRGLVDVTVSTWRAIAEGKTGALFAWCGRVCAHMANNTDALERFLKCGHHIGIIFQMADDVKDVLDTSGLKNRFADIANKEPSYLLIIAAEHAETKKHLQMCWQEEVPHATKVNQVAQSIMASSSIADTYAAMQREVQAALDGLGAYAETSGGSKIAYWLKQLAQMYPANTK